MLSWMRDLETAKDVRDVLNVARHLLDSLPAETVRELPPAWRAHELRDAGDVQWWSERLSEEYWRRRGLRLDVEPIQDAWSFFLRASLRAARLTSREPAANA